jgi:hypothetical protein
MEEPMNPNNEVPEPLVLAAIERAVRHRERDTVPAWEMYAHLGFPNRSGGARAARRQLQALTEAGALEPSRRHGVEVWSLTPAGRRRLRVEGAVDLPESPQHAAWRSARALAGQKIERFTDEARTALADALALIESGTPVRSDALFEAADRLEFVMQRLGSANYCLREWAEPSDDRADIDREEDPADAAIDPEQLGAVRARRRGRRNTGRWTRERA